MQGLHSDSTVGEQVQLLESGWYPEVCFYSPYSLDQLYHGSGSKKKKERKKHLGDSQWEFKQAMKDQISDQLDNTGQESLPHQNHKASLVSCSLTSH